MDKKECNIVLIGGCGMWTETNHIPNILAAKKTRPFLKVVGVCDLVNPYSTSKWSRPHLHELLAADCPEWLQVASSTVFDSRALNALHRKKPIDFIIIACNPTMHFAYAEWALQNNVSIICDKPLVDRENAASDPRAAAQILTKYNRLMELYRQARKVKPHLTFSLILRRRALPAFNIVTERLDHVARMYNAGINHINILNHNGIYKYPAEMQGQGAHDFSMGVGALSHSSYHYIDLFNQYLLTAKGEITHIIPQLTSVLRIREYLAAKSYAPLATINAHEVNSEVVLPDSVLACELDFAVHIDFYNKNGVRVGDGNFISNHASFSSRTRDYVPGVSEPAHFKDGGRASHIYIDIHQSGLQNIGLFKNDIAVQKPRITFRARTHPRVVGLPDSETIHFDDAYNKTKYHMGDMLHMVIDDYVAQRSVQNKFVLDAAQDRANVVLFATFYMLIAKEYVGQQSSPLHNVIAIA